MPQSKNIPQATNPRLKELKKCDSFHTPSGSSPQDNNRMSIGSNSSSNSPANNLVKTPLWLKPQDTKHGYPQLGINIDIENAEFLKTPDGVQRRSLFPSKAETPFEELFTSAIQIAKENSKKPQYYSDRYESPVVVYHYETNDKLKEKTIELNNRTSNNRLKSCMDDSKLDQLDEPMTYDKLAPTQPPIKQILGEHVQVYACNFQKEQIELYELVKQLGGNFLWSYSEDCTHFIYSGSINDDNVELNMAKRSNKIIVAPSWLEECQNQNFHVDEKPFFIGLFFKLEMIF